MVKRLMVAAVAMMAVATACEPAPPKEPTVAITAAQEQPACFNHGLQGVAPAGATKVVLQRTTGGKWTDWLWYEGLTLENPHRISAPVDPITGEYLLQYADATPAGKPLEGTIHIRVRSSGGSVVSNGVFVKFPKRC